MTNWEDFPRRITPDNPFAKGIEFVDEDTGEVITPDQLVEADFTRSLYIKWYPKDADGKFMYTRGQKHTMSKVAAWRPRWIEGKIIDVQIKDKPTYQGWPMFFQSGPSITTDFNDYAQAEDNIDARGIPILPKLRDNPFKQAEDRLFRQGESSPLFAVDYADIEARILAGNARYGGTTKHCGEIALSKSDPAHFLNRYDERYIRAEMKKNAHKWLTGKGWDKPVFVGADNWTRPANAPERCADDLVWNPGQPIKAGDTFVDLGGNRWVAKEPAVASNEGYGEAFDFTVFEEMPFLGEGSKSYPPLVCNQDIISAAARYGQPVDKVLAYINEERADGWNCEVKLYDGLPTIYEEYADGSPAIVTSLSTGDDDEPGLYATYLE